MNTTRRLAVGLDPDGDGFYTLADRSVLSAPLVDAIRTENFDAFLRWLEPTASVQVPRTMRAWVRDHFAQPTMWELLQKLSMPVGLFQGEIDANTSAEQGARARAEGEGRGQSQPGIPLL
jgi:hypothetical protein